MLKLRLCLWGCKQFDRERSYLYVRENSLETNLATTCICCGDWTDDTTRVLYYDRAPFTPSTIRCCLVPCPCCGKTDPKLEVSETGCWCCCQRIVCCDRVVVMPYETFPFPCCCCSNRTAHNCFNCWACCKLSGGLAGSPKKADSFLPQPKNPWDFVAAVGQASGMPMREKIKEMASQKSFGQHSVPVQLSMKSNASAKE